MDKGYGGTAIVTIELRMTARNQADFEEAVRTIRLRVDATIPQRGGVFSASGKRKLADVHDVEVA